MLMYLVFVGPFDSIERGMERALGPLAPLEMEKTLGGREQSELVRHSDPCEFR